MSGPGDEGGGPAPSTRRTSTFRALRHRNFRLFVIGQAVSMIGTWLQIVAQTLLMLELTGSGTYLGLLAMFQGLPYVLVGPWAGVIVDRADTRRLVQITATVMGSTAGLLGILVLTDTVTVPIVFVLGAVLGTANCFDAPARRAFVNELVPQEDLVNAMGLSSTLPPAARLIGPAIAGLLAATVGIGWCFVLNGLSFVPVVIAVALMDRGALSSQRLEAARGQLSEGIRYAWSARRVRVPLLVVGMVSLFSFNSEVLLPLLTTRELHRSAIAYTVLSFAFSIGAVTGTLHIARRARVGVVHLGRAAWSVALGWAILGLAPSMQVAFIGAIFAGGGTLWLMAGSSTALVTEIAPEMRGRVMALWSVFVLGTRPFGGLLIGTLAEEFGTRTAIWVSAIGAAAGAAGTLLWVGHRRRIVAGEALAAGTVEAPA